MKKLLSFLLTVLLCLTLSAAALTESEPLTRAKAAGLLDNLFALSDVKALNVPSFETTPKNLGYTAGNGAIRTDNIIPAAKDAVQLENQIKIETVINSGLLSLDEDGLSFRPNQKMTGKEFALAIAKGLYGADLEIDHLALAQADQIFMEDELTDEPLTLEQAQKMAGRLQAKLQLVSVFVTSDIHGNYIPYTSSDGNFQIGSVSRIKTIMDEANALLGKDNVLYVDGGDSPYNTTLANVSNGDVSVAALNALGLDATVLGNHDFDYSFENLLRLAKNAQYAMLAGNTRYKTGEYPEELKAYIVREAAGLKIGIFGVTDDQSAATTLYSNTADISFDPDLQKAGELVAKLRDDEKCDLIIALSHLHSKNDDLILLEKDIDLSVGGGNDIAGRPTILGNNQYLVNPGKHGEALTQINACVYAGKLTGFIYNQIFLTEAYAEDEETAKLMDGYNAQVNAALDTTIGYLKENLEWSSELVRKRNSPIANLVTDALLDFFKADGAQLCIVNGGGIRAKLDAGEVSIREVTSVLPFDNNMMLVETSGQTIWNALQNGISAYPETNGKFPQVAGMTYTFKAGEPNTLTSVTLVDGTPLDLSARYKVVINSFIAGGGDGYTMLNVLDHNKEMAADVEQLVYLNKTYMRDAMQAYFMNNSTDDRPLEVATDNRIVIE